MVRRLFTKQELKMTKHRLMKYGYSEAHAEEEVANLIRTAEQNHEKAKISSQKAPQSFSDAFKEIKDGQRTR